jgi:hypothetical protein
VVCLAITLIEKRLGEAFPGITYTTHGPPKDMDGAQGTRYGTPRYWDELAVV